MLYKTIVTHVSVKDLIPKKSWRSTGITTKMFSQIKSNEIS